MNNLKHEIFAEHILFNFLNFESIKEIFSSMKNLSVDKISLLSTFLEPENFRKLLKEKFVPDETLSH